MSLSSLKLPELRAICKELKIPYSKLNKAQLIEKIQDKEATRDSPPAKKQKTEPRPPSEQAPQHPPPKDTSIVPSKVSNTAAPPHAKPSAKVVLTRSAPAPPTLPKPSAQSVTKLQTLQDKIAYIENHWLNRLFQQLHANRRQPIIKAPYPGSTGPTQHLAFQGLHPDIYALDEEAFSVALRFWIARLHTMMQLGSGDNWGDVTNASLLGPDFSKWPRVQSCERVGPLWKIKAGEYFLVLGDIGEVLANIKDDDLTHLRSDWQSAITAGAQARIYTKDDGDFPEGIRKAWSKKVPREAQEIARRAVLSSCVLNSFSGTKYTATQMDMEWRGEPIGGTATDNRLAFYLPESHKVVSVHPKGDFTYVQRESGFADIVLSETGQMIGSENGIVDLWQGLLGCDAQGKAKENGYWKDWEVRMYT